MGVELRMLTSLKTKLERIMRSEPKTKYPVIPPALLYNPASSFSPSGPVDAISMSNITVTYRDGRVAQLEQVYIRGSKIRFLILPDMLKNAPMLKSMKNKNQGSGAGRGKAAILKAQVAARGRGRGMGRGNIFQKRR
uniref:Small nuclear ribonucleoprotein D3 polypeptide n=1 Tax=Rattus norvegicus TaxID=10116 RepID=A0A8I5ZKE3_RAT